MALRKRVVTFDNAHCSDRNTVFFKDFNYSVHRLASAVQWHAGT